MADSSGDKSVAFTVRRLFAAPVPPQHQSFANLFMKNAIRFMKGENASEIDELILATGFDRRTNTGRDAYVHQRRNYVKFLSQDSLC